MNSMKGHCAILRPHTQTHTPSHLHTQVYTVMAKTSKLDRNSHFTVNMISKHAAPHTQYAIKINQIKKKKDGVKAMSVCVCVHVCLCGQRIHTLQLLSVSQPTQWNISTQPSVTTPGQAEEPKGRSFRKKGRKVTK